MKLTRLPPWQGRDVSAAFDLASTRIQTNIKADQENSPYRALRRLGANKLLDAGILIFVYD